MSTAARRAGLKVPITFLYIFVDCESSWRWWLIIAVHVGRTDVISSGYCEPQLGYISRFLTWLIIPVHVGRTDVIGSGYWEPQLGYISRFLTCQILC